MLIVAVVPTAPVYAVTLCMAELDPRLFNLSLEPVRRAHSLLTMRCLYMIMSSSCGFLWLSRCLWCSRRALFNPPQPSTISTSEAPR